jgi:hypothetical protein
MIKKPVNGLAKDVSAWVFRTISNNGNGIWESPDKVIEIVR